MSRLSSLTPSRSSRSSLSPTPTTSPSSPPRNPNSETTHHRLLKLLFTEIRTLIRTWDELVLIDGLKHGKTCVDEATEMDNLVGMEECPERLAVGPHLREFYRGREGMEAVLTKLDKLLHKLSLLIDQAEKIFFEAYRLVGPDFALSEPLWLTWTLENFVNSLLPLLSLHNHHHQLLTPFAGIITSPETPFDEAKIALERWQDLGRGGQRWEGVREWEELVELELAGFGREKEREEDEGIKGKRKGRKG